MFILNPALGRVINISPLLTMRGYNIIGPDWEDYEFIAAPDWGSYKYIIDPDWKL